MVDLRAKKRQTSNICVLFSLLMDAYHPNFYAPPTLTSFSIYGFRYRMMYDTIIDALDAIDWASLFKLSVIFFVIIITLILIFMAAQPKLFKKISRKIRGYLWRRKYNRRRRSRRRFYRKKTPYGQYFFVVLLIILAVLGYFHDLETSPHQSDTIGEWQDYFVSDPYRSGNESDFTRCHSPHIIDGDTFDCNGVRIRLGGIDAPEMSGCKPGRRCVKGDGAASRRYLLKLTREHVTCVRIDTDRYDRTVAYCKTDDVADLSCAMVEAGHAIIRYGRPNC